ncbi:MAG: FecR domain-containing protein [Thiomicrospira sp.]|uniref:FecR domain-containing protein n=1 Tax=Thiomicrospira sp. TaxID=935 RepID=UPI0019E572FB|nr:FecR domain-containing protein [Thiomicrospira sp.]MBE0494650.1 FecR domain-containing protein [Thiomicrospira sp.]
MFKRPNHLFFFILFLFANQAWSSIGTIVLATGQVDIQRVDQVIQAKTGSAILEQDKILTHASSRAQLRFSDNTVITLGSNTEFGVDSFLNEGSNQAEAKFNIAKGTFKVITGQIGKAAPDKFKVKTRTATIGIRGTIFTGRITEDRETIATISGQIFVTEDQTGVTVDVPAGQLTNITPGQPPETPKPLTNEDLQQINEESGEQTEDESGESSEGQAGTNDETEDLQNTGGLTEPTDSANGGQTNVDTQVVDQSLDAKIEKDIDDQVSNVVEEHAEVVVDDPVEVVVDDPVVVGDPLPAVVTGWQLPSYTSYNLVQDPCLECQPEQIIDYEQYYVWGALQTSQFDLVGTFDDYVGWGTWQTDTDINGFWVGGTEVSQAAAHVDLLISERMDSYTYSGQVLGEVINPTTNESFLINTSTSNLSLTFDFAQSSIDGSVQFSATDGSNWDLNVDNQYETYVGGEGFNAGLIGNQIGEAAYGGLNGMFYGPNAESVGGEFWADKEGLLANGVFKAVKQ